SIKKILKENIIGADILDYNVRRTKVLLSIIGLLNNEIVEETDFDIKHIDSLKYKWKNEFNVIVGNPPYVKYQDLNNDNRIFLSNNWETIKNGTFNLYFAFFELGHKLLSNDGRLGYITPNNYFTSLAGLSLRQYFHKYKCLRRIIDFSHKKVFDAQTYTAITFLNRENNKAILYDRIPDNQFFSEFLNNVDVSPNYLNQLNVKKWRLLKKQEQKNIRNIERIGTPLNNIFDINVGIATLKDEIYFVDSSYEEDDLLVKETNNGTFYIEKEITKPVYKISNIKKQEDIDNNSLRVITPYYFTRKGANPIPESEFKKNYPNCFSFLLSEKEKLQNRDKGKVKYEPFYVWGRTQGLSRKGKKIVTPTFSKQPRFLFINKEDSYFTNGYGLFFKQRQADIFEKLIHPISKEENYQIALKILNSIIMEYYINITSVSIQGGYPCFQKNFIERFTIPEFTVKELEILERLTDKNEIDNFLLEKYQINIPEPKRFSYT
ncbi:MAG: Eco57I restriction-modification methylase domain-containing protein, partial [Bacteroidales bacterium]|nr:Eco57I restriction-modification methylase domain-containing protein [Bacteroidales bacterium]